MVAFLLACGAGGAVARAEVVYHVVPTLSMGATDNATATGVPGQRVRDEYGTANLSAGLRYERPLSTHGLSYFASYTRYFEGHGPTSISNGLAWGSLFKLSARVDLAVGASASLTRASRVDITDLTTMMPTYAVGGASYLFNVSASQGLSYQPNGRRTFTQALSAGQLHYLDNQADLPTATFILAQLRGTHAEARDSFFLDLQLGDTHSSSDDAVPGRTFAQGDIFMARINLGWQRELAAAWSGNLQAGPVAIFKLSGTAVIAPAGALTVNYTRRPWFATVTLSQAPTPNIYLGDATINDQAMLRLALPVDKREQTFVTAFAAYTYARIANRDGFGGRAYDQRTAGLSVSMRFPQLPFGASLQYTIVDQDGGTATGRPVADLMRQTIMLTVSGVFAFGPGTPPLFSGGP